MCVVGVNPDGREDFWSQTGRERVVVERAEGPFEFFLLRLRLRRF